MKFNSILIGSENPGRLTEYYTKLFGEPAMSDGTYSGWKIETGLSPSAHTTRSRAGTRSPGVLSGISSPPTSRVTTQSSRLPARRLFVSLTVLAIHPPG